MVCRCDFVAFREDLRLQSPIIRIFRDRACVWTTEQSRTVENSRVHSTRKPEKNPVQPEKNPIWSANRRKIRYNRRKLRYFRRKIRYPYLRIVNHETKDLGAETQWHVCEVQLFHRAFAEHKVFYIHHDYYLHTANSHQFVVLHCLFTKPTADVWAYITLMGWIITLSLWLILQNNEGNTRYLVFRNLSGEWSKIMSRSVCQPLWATLSHTWFLSDLTGSVVLASAALNWHKIKHLNWFLSDTCKIRTILWMRGIWAFRW